MKTRVLSGLAMVPFLGIIWLGDVWLLGAGAILSMIGLNEFYNGFRKREINPSLAIGYGSILLLYGLNFIFNLNDWDAGIILPSWIALVVISSMIYGFKVKERKLTDMISTLFGIFYVGFLFYQVVLIDQSAYPVLIWLVFLSAFGTDIFAYFVGVTVGKHKLCPDLSPKKSIEGAVGGVVGSILLATGFGLIFAKEMVVVCSLIGFVGSIAAQLGDLSASAFKRQMGMKDYGNLIPGHGGVLDRFDSVLFVAPVVYCFVLVLEM